MTPHPCHSRHACGRQAVFKRACPPAGGNPPLFFQNNPFSDIILSFAQRVMYNYILRGKDTIVSKNVACSTVPKLSDIARPLFKNL